MKPWIIYTRVSTDDQAREGCSLDAQRDACEAMAKALSLPVLKVLTDAGVSAKNLDRPAIQEGMNAVDRGEIAGVIVYKLDRLTRSRRDLEDVLERFQRTGCGLISVSEKLDTSSPMGRFFVAMLGAIAQWERETIVERVTMGIRYRKSQGGFVGGQVPIGLIARGEPGKRVLEVDERWAPVVREVWPQLIRGRSLRQVAEWLNEKAVPNGRTGTGWTPAGLRKTALSSRYVGLLCTTEEQERTRAVLSSRFAPGRPDGVPSKTQTHTARPWPLTGIAKCGSCGSPLVGVTATSGSGVAYPYYRCTGRVAHGVKKCRMSDLRAEVWEGAVIHALLRSIENSGKLLPALMAFVASRRKLAGPLESERSKIVMERDRLGIELHNLTELAAQGGFVAQGLGPGLAERQRRWNEADRHIASIDGQLAAAIMTESEAEAQMELLRSGISALGKAPLEDQAKALQMMVESVTLRRNAEDKNKGEVDLSIHLPRGSDALFVSACPLVEHGTRGTNAIRWSEPVSLMRSDTYMIPSQWN